MISKLFGKSIYKEKPQWTNIEYPVKDQIINNKLISNTLNRFWKYNIIGLTDEQYLMILFRIKISESGDIKTVTKMQKITKKDLELLKSYLSLKLGVAQDAYFELPISSIIISYGIREYKYLKDTFVNTLREDEVDKNKISTHTWYSHKLPIEVNINKYGYILNSIENVMYNIKVDNKTLLTIKIEERDGYKYHLIDFIKNNKKLYSFEDKILDEKRLVRTIGRTIIDYTVGGYPSYRTFKKYKKIDKVKPDPKIITNIITADIETYSTPCVSCKESRLRCLRREVMVPYLACFYKKGVAAQGTYVFNKNPEDLFKEFFDLLFTRAHNKHQIYFHNLAGFDNFFFFKYLIKFGYKVKPIIHNGKFIQITVKKGKYTYKLKDSYLLLPQSLDKLGKSFNVESGGATKSIFPYLLSDLDYVGDYPEYKYFNKVKEAEYLRYKREYLLHNESWTFREESIKYCINDCKVLYQVLMKFNQLIFTSFKKNISGYPTAPSLAFGIYRTLFLKKDTIPMITGKIKRDIQLGYTGGSTELFIPKNPIGTKIYGYDVNSLYPSVMIKLPYPIGDPTYFEGGGINKDSFGFYYVDVTTPLDIKHPILQLHIKTEGGIRTISPLGKFSGWFFSEELKNAEKFGYSYEIKRGYLFEKGNIFKDFVAVLYNLRVSYDKNHPMNYIAKLLLNSLYGRFGMSDVFMINHIVAKKDYPDFEYDYSKEIVEVMDFDGSYLVRTTPDTLDTELDGREIHNVSIPVSSAVSAYARIHMSQFKNNPNLPNLYYTDTDSAYFDGPIPNDFISNTELGKMKLEGVYDQAVFLAPKVYALKGESGEIIKVKGLSKEAIINNSVTIDVLELLLHKDYKLSFKQNKWFKNISKGNIKVLEQVYTLQTTSLKRELVYDEENKFIATKPILLNN